MVLRAVRITSPREGLVLFHVRRKVVQAGDGAHGRTSGTEHGPRRSDMQESQRKGCPGQCMLYGSKARGDAIDDDARELSIEAGVTISTETPQWTWKAILLFLGAKIDHVTKTVALSDKTITKLVEARRQVEALPETTTLRHAVLPASVGMERIHTRNDQSVMVPTPEVRPQTREKQQRKPFCKT